MKYLKKYNENIDSFDEDDWDFEEEQEPKINFRGELPPYPGYTKELLKYLPSVILNDDNFTYRCDIDDFINVDENEEYISFAGNMFDDQGIDFLKDFRDEFPDEKIEVGGIPSPGYGRDNIDLYGDTIYIYIEKSKENENRLKQFIGVGDYDEDDDEEGQYLMADEFDYYDQRGGYYRIWWD